MSNQIHYSDEEFDQLALYVQQMIEQIERLPYPDVREFIFELLKGIDVLHREALARIMQNTERRAPELKIAFEQDRVIRSLFALYDLLPNLESNPKNTINGFVPLDHVDVLATIKQPIWIPGGHLDDLTSGELRAQSFDGVSVLLYRYEGEIYAVQNACIGSVLPLAQGTVEAYELTCPWHGCKYDIRTGQSPDYPNQQLLVFPVEIMEDGRFTVGFNVGH